MTTHYVTVIKDSTASVCNQFDASFCLSHDALSVNKRQFIRAAIHYLLDIKSLSQYPNQYFNQERNACMHTNTHNTGKSVKILVWSYHLNDGLSPLAYAIVPVLNINETITFSLNKVTILYFYLNVKHQYF